MNIRQATPDDIPAIQRIARTTYHDTYAGQMEEGTIAAVMENWYSDEHLQEAISADTGTYFVATRNGEVVGYASVSWESDADDPADSELENIYVDPDHQQEGVGTALLEHIISYLPDDVESIGVGVLAGNEKGKSFYRRHGFEQEAEVEEDLFGEVKRCELLTKEVDTDR